MKGRFWRKALAAALALLVVSGNVPIRSVADLFGGAAITASAEEGASGQCGENAYFSFDTATHKLTISGTGEMSNYNGENQPWSAYKNNITSVEIENGITSIGNSAFDSFANLTSVSIPDSVKSIGADAFSWCTSLTSVTIPDSVESIGVWAFSDCTGLTSITIPVSVKSIGKDAFYNCTKITDVYCYADPKNLTWNEVGCDDFIYDLENATEVRHTTICHVREEYLGKYNEKFGSSVNVTFKAEKMDKCGDHAYWCFDSKTRKLTISGTGNMADYEYDGETGGVTSPWYAYKGNITSVVIENGITSIGNSAFESFANLTSVSIPDSVKSIGNQAFYRCTGLKSITIPDSVTNIGEYAFEHCTSLTSITIPDRVTNIGEDAFYDCTGITDVYCYSEPDKLTWNEADCDDFMGAQESRETVCHVPKKYLDDYETKFGAGSDYPVNVTFVGDIVDMGLGEHLYGHSITLDGSIGVNFFVELTDALLASETAAMVFTVPNGSKTDTQTLLVKDVIANDKNKVSIGSKTYYKFRCSISAKDMASEITAQLVDGESKGKEYTYSVKDYAEYLLSHTEVKEYADAASLVKAMLNYGAYSQRYFKEGTAIGEVQNIADVTVPNTFKFNEASTALTEGVTFEGATLSLKSETTLSIYFKGLPDDTAFTCDGKTVETAKNGEYVVARIRGIKANELENDFTVTFEGGSSVTYNAMTYCYNVLNDGTVDDNLKNVCKALYNYAQAAINYAG